MRLWSIHPEYLDAKGLVSLWREALLAQKVLLGLTTGYKNHPQLNRFKQTYHPVKSISSYLWAVLNEADKRGYRFNEKKISRERSKTIITVTEGQIDYEFNHLLEKLKKRKPDLFETLKNVNSIKIHPVFEKTVGGIECWEKI